MVVRRLRTDSADGIDGKILQRRWSNSYSNGNGYRYRNNDGYRDTHADSNPDGDSTGDGDTYFYCDGNCDTNYYACGDANRNSKRFTQADSYATRTSYAAPSSVKRSNRL